MKQTLVIDNFKGSMTIYTKGDVNSGYSNALPTGGNDPFKKPGSLTWSQNATQIDSGATVITDLIMDGKERVESGILYVYAIGHTGRLYKIQVNDPAGYNPDLDNPVLLATLSSGTPTFTRGGFIDFYGTTERIYIGHDKGVTQIDFDGTNEAVVGIAGSWTQTVPRPLKQFLGKLYIGNGVNLAEVDSTSTVTSYTKFSPSFPDNTQVRDIDVSVDGNYLNIVVSRLALGSLIATTPDTSQTASSESFIYKWNGTDIGYTAFTTYPSFSIGANIMYQNYQYVFGYDMMGMAMFNPFEKKLTIPELQCPCPNAIVSTGNLLTFMAPLFYDGVLEAELFYWGNLDFEVGPGYWDTFWQTATGDETDVIRIPCQIMVSNFGFGASSSGYTNENFGTSKIYFSTLETSSAPTTKYKFYKYSIIPYGYPDLEGTALTGGLYETQTQMFSKKVSVSEVRIYGEPWIANVSFQIDLIGSAGTPISGGTYTFTAGTTLTVGSDYAWYGPDMAPTYGIGVRITNLGTANSVISKIEVDVNDAGK